MISESKIAHIYDLGFWYGINNLNNQITVEKDNLESCFRYLRSEKIEPQIIVSSFFSLFYEPVKGDDQLAEIIKDRDDLAGVMFFPNFLFSAKKEFKDYLEKRSREGFKIIRLAPKTHKYCIENWAFSYFYSVLEKHRIPVLINLEELDVTGNKAIEWKILFDISDKFPELPVIIDGGNSKELMFNNYFFQLLSNTKNIFLETHNLLAFNQIEDISEEFGSQRLMFGSNYPHYPYYMSLNRIREARLPGDAKKNILSGNFKRLMKNRDF